MDPHNGGNIVPEVTHEEHDHANGAKRVTIGAISVSGSLPVSFSGNVTLSDSKTYVGLVTSTLGVGDRYIGLVTNTQVGLVTVIQTGNSTIIHGSNVTLNPSSANIGSVSILGGIVGISGNITLSDSKGYIGLNTVTVGVGTQFIGLVTVVQSSSARTITGNVTLSNPNTYIGLTTTTLGVGTQFIGLVTTVQASSVRTITGNITLSNPNTYIGLTTSTLGLGDRFIGLVTSSSRNAGTLKTLIPITINFSTTSVTTIAVPTGGNAIFNITQALLSANATVRLSIKSGVTYLTGNASIGVSLNPGGGWVDNGSPDSPVYIGLASGAAIVVEKNDITTSVGGRFIYFQE